MTRCVVNLLTQEKTFKMLARRSKTDIYRKYSKLPSLIIDVDLVTNGNIGNLWQILFAVTRSHANFSHTMDSD